MDGDEEIKEENEEDSDERDSLNDGGMNDPEDIDPDSMSGVDEDDGKEFHCAPKVAVSVAHSNYSEVPVPVSVSSQ